MTENQRDYLADLAGRKGIILRNTGEWSVSQASAEIDRLKELPDATFGTITDQENEEIDKRINRTLSELRKWGFVNG